MDNTIEFPLTIAGIEIDIYDEGHSEGRFVHMGNRAGAIGICEGDIDAFVIALVAAKAYFHNNPADEEEAESSLACSQVQEEGDRPSASSPSPCEYCEGRGYYETIVETLADCPHCNRSEA